MKSRDDFSSPIKRQLAARVEHKCSNLSCRASTSGPQLDESGSIVSLRVTEHITAASSKSPRYDSSLTTKEQCGAENGTWLCQTCGKLIESGVKRFTARMLWEWTDQAESAARVEIGRILEGQSAYSQSNHSSIIKQSLELRHTF